MRENGEETEKWKWLEGGWVQKMISVEHRWHHRFFSWSERASWHRLPLCLGENHRKPNTGKSLSLYIIRQITSAGPALSGFTHISHGLKMKSKSRPPLLLNVPTLPHCKNDDLLYSCIHRYMRPAAVSLQKWQTGTSGITPDSPAGLSQRQLLQTMCYAVFPWKIDGRWSVWYRLIWVAYNITADCAFQHVNVIV